ncbi:hypothetical protein OMCYN_01740 [cyanobiont of Ornithocercus magnificus]|nr:hypothetical protein OMCYN_01740 [cyanobiont of Ornithocercus magnificus]
MSRPRNERSDIGASFIEETFATGIQGKGSSEVAPSAVDDQVTLPVCALTTPVTAESSVD